MAAEEVVDVIDADDRVLRRATRADVRAENLLHRACYVVVLDDEDRLFVHLRTPTKDVFPSHYDMMAGGVLAAGEDYASGAQREVREELGVQPRQLREVGALRYEDSSNRVLGRVFECRVTPPLHLQASEVVSGEWLTLAEVEQRITAAPFCPDSLIAFDVWRRLSSGRHKPGDVLLPLPDGRGLR